MIIYHSCQAQEQSRFDEKKRPPLIVNPKHRHVSTTRLLETHQTFMNRDKNSSFVHLGRAEWAVPTRRVPGTITSIIVPTYLVNS